MGISVLIPILLILFLVYSFTRNRSARTRQAAQLRETVVPGARVMTTSGLHATVVEADEVTVVLEIAPGVRTTWVRAAVARRVDDAPAASGPVPGAGEVPGGSTAASAGGARDGSVAGTSGGSTAGAAADPADGPTDGPPAPERPQR